MNDSKDIEISLNIESRDPKDVSPDVENHGREGGQGINVDVASLALIKRSFYEVLLEYVTKTKNPSEKNFLARIHKNEIAKILFLLSDDLILPVYKDVDNGLEILFNIKYSTPGTDEHKLALKEKEKFISYLDGVILEELETIANNVKVENEEE